MVLLRHVLVTPPRAMLAEYPHGRDVTEVPKMVLVLEHLLVHTATATRPFCLMYWNTAALLCSTYGIQMHLETACSKQVHENAV